MPTIKPSERPGIATAPERLEKAMRESTERGRLEREFEVLGELGHGGMGTVFRARDIRLCRDVAVKVLSPSLRLDRTSTRRFAIEAQIAAQREQPNILPFYTLSCDESGQPGIVMRLVDGESLREYLDACGASHEACVAEPRDLASRLERFLKVCDAVEYAHARGVVHRDLKPENVLLGSHNEVYVVDWGLAKLLEPDEAVSEESAKLTENGHTVGSPLYMSPEQANGGRETIGAASDQYALGLLLQELATLESPRRWVSRREAVRSAARNERAPFEHRFGLRLPRSLGAIIAKATAAAPEARYASVADLARDVRHFARGDEVNARPDAHWFRIWRYLRRRPGLVLGTLLSLALIASAATTIATSRELSARARAEKQAQRMSALTAQVGRVVSAIDARVARVDLVVEGMATASAAALDRLPALPPDPWSPEDLAKDAALTKFVARYRQQVTFAHTAMVLSPSVPLPDALVARSGDFAKLLGRAAVRAAGDDEALSLDADEQRSIAREQSPVLWTTIAFKEGVLFVYPANTFFPVDYDARKRPWYTLAASGRSHRWGSPYPDVTNGALLVACSAPMFDAADHFVGAAAMHLSLDELLSRIALPAVEGFRESAVLDERGEIVFSTSERGRLLDAGVHENRTLSRRPFAIDDVRLAVTRGSRDGSARSGDAIVVYQRMASFDWWLAVTFAAASYEAP
jgi:serine/threonine protein kinase